MNSIKSHLRFSKEQKKGLFLLLFIILGLQLFLFFADFSTSSTQSKSEKEWLALQSDVDVLKESKLKTVNQLYPFNPNFISDYKGYKLGMSVEEIDRLLAFRKKNKYVNSASEFQTVTKVSDSLLQTIAPFFKFPDWVINKKEAKEYKNFANTTFNKKEKIVQIDINQATQEDLIKVNGIGEVLSLRILTQKEKLGSFVSMDQLKEVWGLSPEVLLYLNKYFIVSELPVLKKIDINNASLKELSKFYYFKHDVARQIVKYRSMNGDFKNIDDLIKISDFPVDNVKIINLYLSF